MIFLPEVFVVLAVVGAGAAGLEAEETLVVVRDLQREALFRLAKAL